MFQAAPWQSRGLLLAGGAILISAFAWERRADRLGRHQVGKRVTWYMSSPDASGQLGRAGDHRASEEATVRSMSGRFAGGRREAA